MTYPLWVTPLVPTEKGLKRIHNKVYKYLVLQEMHLQ